MLCKKCHKYGNNKPTKGCYFCNHLNLPEEVLCYVARNDPEHGSLSECGAYQPKLSLTSADQLKPVVIENEEINDSNLTDKAKWFIAYSKQQLQLNPEEINFKLQFHLCLVTKKRNIIFNKSGEYLNNFMTIFQQIATSFENTQVEVLWLSSDHIHLYVSTTPDYAFDEIANKLIIVSEEEIQSSYPEIMEKFESIWQVGYFAETIG